MSRCVIAFLMFDACATSPQEPGPLNRAALRVSHPRTITSVVSTPAAFEGHTSGAGALAVFGLVGLAIEQSMVEGEGDKVKGTVYDPASAISVDLVKRLSTRFTLEVVDRPHPEPSPPPPLPPKQSPKQATGNGGHQSHSQPPKAVESKPEKLMEQNRHVDLVLNVATVRWGFMPVRIGRYGINYEGRLRLLDTRTRTVLAEGTCISLPVDTPDAPDYDQMLANDAAILRAMMKSLEDYCIEDYRKRILGLYGQ